MKLVLPGSLHMKHKARALGTLFVYTEFAKKKAFGQLALAVARPVRGRHGRQKC